MFTLDPRASPSVELCTIAPAVRTKYKYKCQGKYKVQSASTGAGNERGVGERGKLSSEGCAYMSRVLDSVVKALGEFSSEKGEGNCLEASLSAFFPPSFRTHTTLELIQGGRGGRTLIRFVLAYLGRVRPP
jgi:hypothetical protein